MRRVRSGFTIIEVMLFFGISGILIVALMVGTSSTISRQRYNDSVQDFAEFLRREYSAVINPENNRENTNTLGENACPPPPGSSAITSDDGRGRSNCLIYGRLIVVGEEGSNGDVFAYDVIGRGLTNTEKASSSATTLTGALNLASVNAVVKNTSASATCPYRTNNEVRYTPQWSASIQTTDSTGSNATVSILIVRSPVNGTVRTLFYDGAINVQQAVVGENCGAATPSVVSALLPEKIGSFKATIHEEYGVNFCVGSEDVFALDGRRRNVRIARNGHNSSAVKIIDKDSEDNQCKDL